MAAILPLISFDGQDGADPVGGLLMDANGDLFGTTEEGGAGYPNSYGTVFEIAKTSTGYASTPTTLVSFSDTGNEGADPAAGLIVDANGDLLGTTVDGGANGDGTVFEIAKTSTGYASTPTTLVSFSNSSTEGAFPYGGLITDANGDLFGTTEGGGASSDGTVFEIAKTATGYASTPTTLASFDGSDGAAPYGSLVFDSDGDLWGTTKEGGTRGGFGTVFAIAKTSTGYASVPNAVISFAGLNGSAPYAGLILLGGALFGTASAGGEQPNQEMGDGTVFEVTSNSPTTLATFDGYDGAAPGASLIQDADGNLFGTTTGGGAGFPEYSEGTVFALTRTDTGYSAPNYIAFTGTLDGVDPSSSLIADASGDLFGTAQQGGESGLGTVFEVTGSGFVPTASAPPPVGKGSDILWRNSNGDTQLWISNGSGGFAPEDLGVIDTSWQIAGTGDFSGDGQSGILWRNSNGDTQLWNPNGSGGFAPEDLGVVGTSWQIAGAGDFDGNGQDSILWRNANGDTQLWNPNGSGGFAPEDLGVIGTSWQIEETGNFTGAGEGILWQNSNGDTQLWNPNGSGGFAPEDLGVIGTSWQIAGAGDFNGNGEDSILWRNANGDTQLWNPNGSGGFAPEDLGVIGTSWQIEETGNFTGAGEGILWQNSNGDTQLWNPNGSGGFITEDLGVVGTNWSVQKAWA